MDETAVIVWLTLKVALCATLIDAPIAIYCGWLLARKEFAGKSLFSTFLTLPLVLPPVVTGYFLLIVLGRNGAVGAALYRWFGFTLPFTWYAAALASAVIALPLFVRAVQVAIGGVDAKLEEAGKVLGKSDVAIFFRITLPLAWPGLAAGALLAFARSLGEFGATIIFAGNIPGETQTITLRIFTLINQPGGEAQISWLLLVAVALAFGSILLNDWLMRRRTLG